jgi:hypothetical protein
VKSPSWQAISGIGSQASVYLCVSDLCAFDQSSGVAATRLRAGGLLVAPNQVQDQGTSGPVVTIMESVVVTERPANPKNFQNQAMKRHAGVMDPFPWRPPV